MYSNSLCPREEAERRSLSPTYSALSEGEDRNACSLVQTAYYELEKSLLEVGPLKSYLFILYDLRILRNAEYHMHPELLHSYV